MFGKKINTLLIVLIILLFSVIGFELIQRKVMLENQNGISNKLLTEPSISVKNSVGDVTQQNRKEVITSKSKEQVYSYYPSVVTLKGVIKELVGDTPEKDRKFTYYVLELNEPINVKGNPDDTEGNTDSFDNVTQVQFMAYGSAVKDIPGLVGKPVIVTGDLYERLEFKDFTDVLIKTNHVIENKECN